MLRMMPSTFAGNFLAENRGKNWGKAHDPTLIFLMAILLIWKKALLPLVSSLICLSKGEHAPTSHPQVWCGSYRILKNLTHPIIIEHPQKIALNSRVVHSDAISMNIVFFKRRCFWPGCSAICNCFQKTSASPWPRVLANVPRNIREKKRKKTVLAYLRELNF